MTNELAEKVAKVKELVPHGARFTVHEWQQAISIITEQDAIIQQQRAVMQQALSVVELQRDKLYTLRRGLPTPWKNSCQDDRIGDMVNSMTDAIAAIDAALNEKGE